MRPSTCCNSAEPRTAPSRTSTSARWSVAAARCVSTWSRSNASRANVMEAVTLLPDERALRADLAAGPFQLGVCLGHWRHGAIEWPFVHIAVAAAERAGGPAEYWFRFDC